MSRAHQLLNLPDLFTAKELKLRYYARCRVLHPDQTALGKEEAAALFIEVRGATGLGGDAVVWRGSDGWRFLLRCWGPCGVLCSVPVAPLSAILAIDTAWPSL